MGEAVERGPMPLRLCMLAVLLAATTTLGSPGAAAQANEDAGRKPANADGRSDPACASYGAGFTRLPGSSTCVKISGGIQADLYSTDVNGSTRVDALAPGLKSK
ncbi:porin [Ancylobacter dichloromethanicus]|uniref:Porin n=1 Tax=Ancylobacter dichloromethanicus TaxID=518825 RepID=A0A9W6J9Q2_9HYPH|nr:porin [Ancylobacter dichloromethanicus]MBS7552622.1 porin [Ancylobacter dichloromethanicus]GLK71984.1 hypothetical protein GCM10017643_21000 [Ancylobacter dichloromethanicus]